MIFGLKTIGGKLVLPSTNGMGMGVKLDRGSKIGWKDAGAGDCWKLERIFRPNWQKSGNKQCDSTFLQSLKFNTKINEFQASNKSRHLENHQEVRERF